MGIMDRLRIPESFDSVTFAAGSRHAENCGSNGLPVTPSSITMIGRFKGFIVRRNSTKTHRRKEKDTSGDHRADDEDHLISYVDCFRNRHERVTLVFEHCERLDWPSDVAGGEDRLTELQNLTRHMLLALHQLHHELYLSHGNITPDSFVIVKDPETGDRIYKLKHWPLNFVTGNGTLLDSDALFPNDIRFCAPERMAHPSRPPVMKSDIWSLALSVLFLMFPNCRFPESPADIACLTDSRSVLRRLGLSESDMPSAVWFSFFDHALQPVVGKRAGVRKLMQVFQVQRPVFQFNLIDRMIRHPELDVKCLSDDSVIQPLDLHEVYYLLTLSSPGFKEEISSPGDVSGGGGGQRVPAILTVPLVVQLSPQTQQQQPVSTSPSSNSPSHSSPVSLPSSPDAMTAANGTNNNISSSSSSPSSSSSSARLSFLPSGDSTAGLIYTKSLRDRLSQLDPELLFPLLIFPTEREKQRRRKKQDADDDDGDSGGTSRLPLVIRETDFAYQAERTILFKGLLEGIPYSRSLLMESAHVDVNPHHRPLIWSAILNVTWSQMAVYDQVDKTSVTPTDRQISVDIPRCHQYNELLASPTGHTKLTRILKAWLAKNEDCGYVYWQGLDSLAAPFLLLNFGDERRAFACFDNFIHKYLRGFFDKDNSDTIQEYLSLFSHLIAFHDPDLFNHLDLLSFTPELYAIPWFLTMFTHVLPLHRTIHVWDTLLFGNESFPLCVGLAVLQQLRPQLLHLSFNDCILIFSDLPELNIDHLVQEAVRLFRATPKSASERDWVPVPRLRSMLCPLIRMEDVVDLVINTNLTIVLLDMRSPELRHEFGPVARAIVLPPSTAADVLRDRVFASFPAYHLLVVINDSFAADQLVRQSVPRVCCVDCESLVPLDLQQQSSSG